MSGTSDTGAGEGPSSRRQMITQAMKDVTEEMRELREEKKALPKAGAGTPEQEKRRAVIEDLIKVKDVLLTELLQTERSLEGTNRSGTCRLHTTLFRRAFCVLCHTAVRRGGCFSTLCYQASICLTRALSPLDSLPPCHGRTFPVLAPTRLAFFIALP